jgi:hypothetical protein
VDVGVQGPVDLADAEDLDVERAVQARVRGDGDDHDDS